MRRVGGEETLRRGVKRRETERICQVRRKWRDGREQGKGGKRDMTKTEWREDEEGKIER